MKIFYCAVLLTFFSLNSVFSQSLPIDFSQASDAFTGFEGSAFSFAADPTNSANEVGQFVNDGSVPFQGFFIDLQDPVDFSTNQQISLDFYSFDSNNHQIIVKFENGNHSDVEVSRSIEGSQSPGWTSLNFDFSSATFSGTNSQVFATGAFSRIAIFIDIGQTNAGTFLIDNIDYTSNPVDPFELDVIYTDLVWSDEFEIDGAVNEDNWFHQTLLPNGTSWFNGEVQHYTDRIENSFVEDGFLNVNAIRETYTDQGQTKDFTSARLNSKFAFTYGRVDVRAKLPLGEGTWPAIWTLGKNVIENGGYWSEEFGEVFWPACGEIDIMEHGLGVTNNVSVALHSPCENCFGNTQNTAYFPLENVADNFHVYSVNWSPNQITFLIDGVAFYTYSPEVQNPATWPFFEDQYLILNVALGGFAGDVEPGFQESSMVVDYVRVFQNITVGTKDAFAESISVYPNPASDRVQIDIDSSLDRLELYNSLGKLVLHVEKPSGFVQLDEIESGIYLLKIYSEGNQAVKKLVVQ
jgi:beta-glucanase (GH16 family)